MTTPDPATGSGVVLSAVAALVPPGSCRVGVDGVDGAGKTTFGDALAEVLRAAGRPVVRVGADSFLQQNSLRHARGRDSPEGFFYDSYDVARLRSDVLDPLAPGGRATAPRYRPRAYDLATDTVLDPPWETAEPDAVLVLDGMFLQRPQLKGCFEVVVFLDVPFSETCRRMHLRDGSPADPGDPGVQRYVEGQRLYLATGPRESADVLIDNTDVCHPRLLRPSA